MLFIALGGLAVRVLLTMRGFVAPMLLVLGMVTVGCKTVLDQETVSASGPNKLPLVFVEHIPGYSPGYEQRHGVVIALWADRRFVRADSRRGKIGGYVERYLSEQEFYKFMGLLKPVSAGTVRELVTADAASVVIYYRTRRLFRLRESLPLSRDGIAMKLLDLSFAMDRDLTPSDFNGNIPDEWRR
jgi:hypothetical protein